MNNVEVVSNFLPFGTVNIEGLELLINIILLIADTK